MATTYSELLTEIDDWLERDDLASGVAATFVDLAEAQINRIVRHWRMEARATATADDSRIAVPDDWLETIMLTMTGNGTRPLELVSRMELGKLRDLTNDSGGTPCYYTHEDGYFHIYPGPDESQAVELLYYQKIPALTDTNTSNWVLANHPDLYLYGALIQAAPYLVEDQRLQVWASLFKGAVQSVNEASNAAKYSGSGLRLKIRSY